MFILSIENLPFSSDDVHIQAFQHLVVQPSFDSGVRGHETGFVTFIRQHVGDDVDNFFFFIHEEPGLGNLFGHHYRIFFCDFHHDLGLYITGFDGGGVAVCLDFNVGHKHSSDAVSAVPDRVFGVVVGELDGLISHFYQPEVILFGLGDENV